ncbi:uncharacterized protein I303_103609 [Kwoniella dejecticola CBS 10117]|uniref:Vacuolar membrane protein n=1 Tax=Kwoniella dejecticola CBS 10117 TaxID=1296121 RepID=A0A1A6A782_9TREE|nr:uncharacterized protein I303_03631 [Kwoniella dejecticola CBS 10117]OBR85916.1 hypothetical protein I303_03631 [Kwoniella dejecticola CBS 10117]
MAAMYALLDYPSRVMIANVLGYMSIGCWLCAQLPQVIKNASLKSCEGLALPFLCSWLFGDITNLLGCLLTDQLPFQTYLAIYFCTIDLALVGQYIHYKPSAPARLPSAAQTPRYVTYNSLISSPHQSLILPPATAPPGRTRSSSGNFVTTSAPNTARPRTKRSQYHSGSNVHHLPPDIAVTSSSPADGSYAAIYEAALDVARAAERASNRRSRSKRRRLSRQLSASNTLAEENGDGDMTDSFHSEMSTSTAGNSPRSANRSRMTQSTGTLLGDNRGRSMTRTNTRSPMHAVTPLSSSNHDENDTLEGLPTTGTLGLVLGGSNNQSETQMREAKRNQSRSLSLVRGSGGRGGRRAAGVAFMSLGLLVGWGGLGGNKMARQGAIQNTGKVLGDLDGLQPDWDKSAISQRHTTQPKSEFYQEIPNIPSHITYVSTDHPDGPSPPPHAPEEPPSLQRIIGRISAWACTNLYLASRLPQIWKNFQRKSVEGLSILLFAMAFMGNVTYVASILLNPAGNGDPNEANHYLLEALPYLLGSGGTLLFDMTIMIQSVIYGSSPPLPIQSTTLDRNSRRRGYFSKKRIKHIEDGRPHSAHVRSHSYTQHSQSVSRSQSQSQYLSNPQHDNENETTPLLPPADINNYNNNNHNLSHNGLGIVGIDSNRSGSRARSKSPEKKISKERSRKRSIADDNDVI